MDANDADDAELKRLMLENERNIAQIAKLQQETHDIQEQIQVLQARVKSRPSSALKAALTGTEQADGSGARLSAAAIARKEARSMTPRDMASVEEHEKVMRQQDIVPAQMGAFVQQQRIKAPQAVRPKASDFSAAAGASPRRSPAPAVSGDGFPNDSLVGMGGDTDDEGLRRSSNDPTFSIRMRL